MKVTRRIRLKEKDIYYDKYIGVCRLLEYFDYISKELFIRCECYSGVLKEYEELEFSKPLVCRDYIDVVGQVISFNDRVLKIKFEVLKVLDGVSEEYLLITNMVCKAVCIFEVLRN